MIDLDVLDRCNGADEFYSCAFGFYKAYTYVERGKTEEYDPLTEEHYLLCHALELALKGWLMLEGDDPEMLRKRLGHDLGALLHRVIEVYGARAFPEDHAELIGDLNRSYRGKDYEYPARTDPLISISPLSVLAKFVNFCVEELIRKSRAKRMAA